MNRNIFNPRLVLGIVALVLWLVFFSGGLLIETVEWRAYLAPHEFPNRVKSDQEAGVTSTPYKGETFGDSLYAVVAAALWFTPTNLAFLALLAGLMGGCASNILVDRLPSEQADRIKSDRLAYLRESPWSATMRSFVVYLCIIAGLYFVVSDPFRNSTPAQYVRLAGTISVVAFLVGHDPTRIRDWIGLIPSPSSQKVTVTEDAQGGLKVEAKQGPGAASREATQWPQEPLIAVNSDNGDPDSDETASGVKPR